MSGARLGPDDVLAFCERTGVKATMHRLGTPTPTVGSAAAAVGAEPGRIVKSLVFLARGTPVVVVAAGDGRVGYQGIARALGVSRKELRFATQEEALGLTGYVVGAMPPFGHLTRLKTLLDSTTLPAHGAVFAGGGALDALVELDAADLLAACGGELAPVASERP